MWLTLLDSGLTAFEEEIAENGNIVPFLMFCVFLVGILVIVVGAVNLFTEWREFRIFYDATALEEKPDAELKKKKMIKHGIVIAVGIVLIIISYL